MVSTMPEVTSGILADYLAIWINLQDVGNTIYGNVIFFTMSTTRYLQRLLQHLWKQKYTRNLLAKNPNHASKFPNHISKFPKYPALNSKKFLKQKTYASA